MSLSVFDRKTPLMLDFERIGKKYWAEVNARLRRKRLERAHRKNSSESLAARKRSEVSRAGARTKNLALIV